MKIKNSDAVENLFSGNWTSLPQLRAMLNFNFFVGKHFRSPLRHFHRDDLLVFFEVNDAEYCIRLVDKERFIRYMEVLQL